MIACRGASDVGGRAWHRALRLLQERPTAFYANGRAYALFAATHALRRLLPPPGVEFGENVRLQRLSSVMAEAPGGRIVLGADSIVFEDSRLEAYGFGCITIGAGSLLGGARIACRSRIELGRRVLTSWNVFIQDYDPHPLGSQERRLQVEDMVRRFQPCFSRPRTDGPRTPSAWSPPSAAIVIGDDVWIGANVTILKGAVIGSGCVIGAGAVVTRGSYPPDALIVGNPARVAKSLAPGRGAAQAGAPPPRVARALKRI